MKIFLICTEYSGEQILEDYLDILKKIYPQSEFFCQMSWTKWIKKNYQLDDRMHFIGDRSLCSVMGYVEPLKRLYPLWKRRNLIKKMINAQLPQMLFTFDGPDFSLNICQYAKDRNVYVTHVVAPSVWAWKSYRIGLLNHCSHELHYLFKFEKRYFQDTSLELRYIGHRCFLKKSPRLRQHLKNLVLAPGSREQEIKTLLPFFAKLALELKSHGEVENIYLSVSPHIQKKVYEPYLQIFPVILSFEEALDVADFAFVCSGTASLEFFAHGCPHYIFYSIASWKVFFLSLFIKTPFIGLPNIVAQALVVPEFYGHLESRYHEIISRLKIDFFSEGYAYMATQLYNKAKEVYKDHEKICLQTAIEATVKQELMRRDEAHWQDLLLLQHSQDR